MAHQENVNSCSEISMAHSARLMERSTHTDAELPENVVKIEAEDDCKIYVVGTAHFSVASQQDVSQVYPKIYCNPSTIQASHFAILSSCLALFVGSYFISCSSHCARK